MDSNEYKNICRICLEENVWLDWKTPLLYQFHDMTYKDCYYKYTQLERNVTDNLPQMLCENCCNALHSTHTLISTALKSHKILEKKLSYHVKTKEKLKSTRSKMSSRAGSRHCTPTELETVLVERIKIEPIIDDHFTYEGSHDAETLSDKKPKAPKTVRENVKPRPKREPSILTQNKFEEHSKNPPNIPLEMNSPSIKLEMNSKSIVGKAETINDNKNETVMDFISGDGKHIVECISIECNLMDGSNTTENEGETTTKVEPKAKKESRYMCSICPKILHSKRALIFHEETHVENRERKEICKVCGLKFFEQRNLDAHMRIHKKGREKRNKCEFCSKAFYDKGALNIHRRIHLGQMIPCSLCPKEFYRQVDLDKHMNSHSATAINSNIKKRSRYFVRCPHCDKSILSTTFKSHTAAHLNEPLMKCSICDKEFFSRKSCVIHVKKKHEKTNEEYNDFIVKYAKDRISQLFLKQHADVQTENK